MKITKDGIVRGAIKAVFVMLAVAGGFAIAMTLSVPEPVQAATFI